MVYLEPESLSPDPTRGRRCRPITGNRVGLDVYPHALVAPVAGVAALKTWSRRLSIHKPHPELDLPVTPTGLVELTLDFGTELEAELEIRCRVATPCSVCVLFGEGPLEVTGVALPTIVPHVPLPVEHYHFESAGLNTARFAARGFRFVRIVFADADRGVRLVRVVAHAVFACRSPDGGFWTDDHLLQRAWEASLYTARLCTRPEAYWDGIKRDRVGWYGDARITQQTMDCAFVNPVPAERMLLAMPVDSWANQIPTYSFDGIAMFRQLLLRYGPGRHTNDIYRRIRAMMKWTERTQINGDGLFARNEAVDYFFGIGFIDWSPMPMGGRFEEVSWMQFRWLEALRLASDAARWTGHRADAARWAGMADRLAPKLIEMFYRKGKGFVHTLNRSSRAWEKNEPDRHYSSSYVQKTRLGASGPSRHSSSLAVLAGLASDPSCRSDVLRVLSDPLVPAVITPYFAWFEQTARAECGDSDEALRRMLTYVGTQVVAGDSATVWESFEPEVKGLRRWSLGRWAKSLCHGWSSGLVPMVERYLVGVRPVLPGFDAVELLPRSAMPWSFDAAIPTPHGPIRAVCERGGGPVHYRVPRPIAVAGSGRARVTRV